MIKGLPLTSLIVLNALCPCRTPHSSCCRSGGEFTLACCACHVLLHDARSGAGLECTWPLHAIINGHAQFEQDAIHLVRECLSASVPFEIPAIYSREEIERLKAMVPMLREFLGEYEDDK